MKKLNKAVLGSAVFAAIAVVLDLFHGNHEPGTKDTIGQILIGLFAHTAVEITVLGFLVAVWEVFHSKDVSTKIRLNQVGAMKSLLFFLEVNEPVANSEKSTNGTNSNKTKDPGFDPSNAFKSAVDDSLCDLRKSSLNKEDFVRLLEKVELSALHPVGSEALFHNLELALGGLQDLAVDGQEREKTEQEHFENLYKNTRMLAFLSQRYSSLSDEREKVDVKSKGKLVVNKLNVLLGVIDALVTVVNSFNQLVENNPDEIMRVHDASVARILHAVISEYRDFDVKLDAATGDIQKLRVLTKQAIDSHPANSNVRQGQFPNSDMMQKTGTDGE